MMKRNKNSKSKFKIRTTVVVIIVAFIGSIGSLLSDTIFDWTAVEADKIKVKHINSIHDGDTINVTISNGKTVKIRLFGIDAPELKQPFGKEAQICLEKMIKDKNITYLPRDKKKNTDKYGRTVAIIFDGDKNINLEMVKKGCAWNYTQYNKSLYTLFAQIAAQNQKMGLWKDDNPQAPWDYRHRK